MSWPDWTTLNDWGLLLDAVGFILVAGTTIGFRKTRDGYLGSVSWLSGEGRLADFIRSHGWNDVAIEMWGARLGWVMIVAGFAFQLFSA